MVLDILPGIQALPADTHELINALHHWTYIAKQRSPNVLRNVRPAAHSLWRNFLHPRRRHESHRPRRSTLKRPRTLRVSPESHPLCLTPRPPPRNGHPSALSRRSALLLPFFLSALCLRRTIPIIHRIEAHERFRAALASCFPHPAMRPPSLSLLSRLPLAPFPDWLLTPLPVHRCHAGC